VATVVPYYSRWVPVPCSSSGDCWLAGSFGSSVATTISRREQVKQAPSGPGVLHGIGDEEGVHVCERVHAGTGGEIVGVLGTAVEHDDQGCRLPGVAARNVQLVGAGSGLICIGTLDVLSSWRNNGRFGHAYLRLRHGAGQAAR
jgi:hypothetical protein